MSIIALHEGYDKKENKIARLDGMINVLDVRLQQLSKEWEETTAWRQLLIDSANKLKEKEGT